MAATRYAAGSSRGAQAMDTVLPADSMRVRLPFVS